MKKILTLIIVFSSLVLFAQEKEQDKEKGKGLNPADLQSLDIPDSLRTLIPYGTLENAFGGNKNQTGIVDIVPRFGIQGKWKIDDSNKYYCFALAEVGVHLTRRNQYISVSADPGSGSGKIDQAIFARKGVLGIGTPFGEISMGKRWGVHYELAGNVDDMYMFGGDALGVYNAGTDGGVSGTGRADQALIYEYRSDDKFYLGLQSQYRNFEVSDRNNYVVNNKMFSDVLGIASTYKFFNTLKIGASFTKVFDGVENPIDGQTKIGDQLASFLIDFRKDNFQFALISNAFDNHEKTDLGKFYSGYSFEYHIRYNFAKNKWSFVNNSSILMPYEEENTKYINNRYSFELARRFSANTVAILGFRYDNSTNSNGLKSELHTWAIGMFYNFNYPVP
ncbi:MAG: porin [Ichthyobacteriaceae bacterium]|nr:porin [Ichthyobacteriaceae bacterium]